MKTKLIAVALLSVLSPNVNASDNFSLITGGWSNHHVNEDYKFNETHNAIGVIYKDYIVSTFDNSYNNRSWVFAKQFNVNEATISEKYNASVSFDVAVGVVTGYEDYQVSDAYIGNGVSAYFLPTVSLKVMSFGVDVGVIPMENGYVNTFTARMYF